VKLKKNKKYNWNGADVVLHDQTPKYVGCVLHRTGNVLHPVYTIVYLSTRGWTMDAKDAYLMTEDEAWKFKIRGGIKVWTVLYTTLQELHKENIQSE